MQPFWRRSMEHSLLIPQSRACPDCRRRVACWRGEVLAQVAVEVVELASPFGAATVVHVVDGEAMAATARSICSHYRLSRLYGFDFIIDERSGATKLIEINPRATQIGHFNLGPTWRRLCSRPCQAVRPLGGHLFNRWTFLCFRANGVATRKVPT